MRLREIKPGMVIHCKTEKETMLLCEWVKKRNGLSSTKDFESEMVDAFRNDYCFEIRENCLKTTVNWGGKAVEFSDFIIPDLSPAEVLKICNEICKNVSLCENCIMVGNCFAERDSDYQKVVEICEQWKVDHEKKEPEVEWVDICRIIQVHDGGKKECVHEVPVLESIADKFAEWQLKKYIEEHEGNYIAVVEHVCRAKGEK